MSLFSVLIRLSCQHIMTECCPNLKYFDMHSAGLHAKMHAINIMNTEQPGDLIVLCNGYSIMQMMTYTGFGRFQLMAAVQNLWPSSKQTLLSHSAYSWLAVAFQRIIFTSHADARRVQLKKKNRFAAHEFGLEKRTECKYSPQTLSLYTKNWLRCAKRQNSGDALRILKFLQFTRIWCPFALKSRA